ncbi:MAG: hypothetical protein R2726_16585 [Acidimicrobiales bacterium]
MYIGTKQKTGNEVEKAGLTNGTLYGLKIADVDPETDATGGAGFIAVTLVPSATCRAHRRPAETLSRTRRSWSAG